MGCDELATADQQNAGGQGGRSQSHRLRRPTWRAGPSEGSDPKVDRRAGDLIAIAWLE